METLVWALGLMGVCVALGLAVETLMGPLDPERKPEDER